MQVPGVIIFVNDSVTTAILNTLPTDTGVEPDGLVPNTPYPSTIQGIDAQLQINETITLAEFNARVASDPNYPKVIHLNRLRILVILPDFQDTTNRHLADIVLFVKQGLGSVEQCKFGPPGLQLPVDRINIFNLLYGVRHSGNTVFCFPCFPKPPPICPPVFPPPICPPQIQTIENPRPPERHHTPFPEGMGTLELFGVEAMETEHGRKIGVFGKEDEGPRPHSLLPDDDACCVDKAIEFTVDPEKPI